MFCQFNSFDPPSSANSHASHSSNASSVASRNSSQLLEAHRIHIDRGCQLPLAVKELVAMITQKRVDDPTSKSHKVKDVYPNTSKMLELEAQHVLHDLLGYRGEQEDVEGLAERHIKRGMNRLFNTDEHRWPYRHSRSFKNASTDWKHLLHPNPTFLTATRPLPLLSQKEQT